MNVHVEGYYVPVEGHYVPVEGYYVPVEGYSRNASYTLRVIPFSIRFFININ
jgi:hypothetical protein